MLTTIAQIAFRRADATRHPRRKFLHNNYSQKKLTVNAHDRRTATMIVNRTAKRLLIRNATG